VCSSDLKEVRLSFDKALCSSSRGHRGAVDIGVSKVG
jgi:hypothetical protein